MSAIQMTCDTCGAQYMAGMVGVTPWPAHVCHERQLDAVAGIASDWNIPRSRVRMHIAQGTCPCGSPGANPCHRMGGEAACVAAPKPTTGNA